MHFLLDKHRADVLSKINNADELSEETFSKLFKNQKSKKTISTYYNFYKALRLFIKTKTADSLDKMLSVYEKGRDELNKAFGDGHVIFENRKGSRPTVDEFLSKEQDDILSIDVNDFNKNMYLRFMVSKNKDKEHEYFDTTIRIFKATGLISFKKGYVELVCDDLCELIFNKKVIKSMIFGDITKDSRANKFADYEEKTDSYYHTPHSLISILGYNEKKVSDIIKEIKAKFAVASLDEIAMMINKRRRSDFETFVANKYPEGNVKELLGLFADRSNDAEIKKKVCPDADVPTIYEYVVGLAWYYFSNKSIDLLNSYNLHLSADFEPLSHAGGGMGDIVIYEDQRVIMLEATLMNTNSQKRGEWEPVLRHSVNLKIDEESDKNREVTTFFIADTFDFNTINIWKAVSSVPLQSSTDKEKYTDRVIIMPVSSSELSALMDKKENYDKIIEQVRQLFLKDITKFDKEWREKFISALIK